MCEVEEFDQTTKQWTRFTSYSLNEFHHDFVESACRELEIGPQHLEELRPKMPSELRVSVAHNAFRNSPKLHNVFDE